MHLLSGMLLLHRYVLQLNLITTINHIYHMITVFNTLIEQELPCNSNTKIGCRRLKYTQKYACVVVWLHSDLTYLLQNISFNKTLFYINFEVTFRLSYLPYDNTLYTFNVKHILFFICRLGNASYHNFWLYFSIFWINKSPWAKKENRRRLTGGFFLYGLHSDIIKHKAHHLRMR